jgi:general secretion pathway protein G
MDRTNPQVGPRRADRSRDAFTLIELVVSRDAFTLIELVVVIIVIGVLAGLVAPRLLQNVGKAKTGAARAQVEMLGLALDNYRLDNNYYPTTDQGLQALVSEPDIAPIPRNWDGPYLKKREVPLDPWGKPYVYRSPGEVNPDSYDLFTLGRDGVEGGEGEDQDVYSWE